MVAAKNLIETIVRVVLDSRLVVEALGQNAICVRRRLLLLVGVDVVHFLVALVGRHECDRLFVVAREAMAQLHSLVQLVIKRKVLRGLCDMFDELAVGGLVPEVCVPKEEAVISFCVRLELIFGRVYLLESVCRHF